MVATTYAHRFWNPQTGETITKKPVRWDGHKPIYGSDLYDEAPKIWDVADIISERAVEGAFQQDGAYPFVQSYRHRETGATYDVQIFK